MGTGQWMHWILMNDCDSADGDGIDIVRWHGELACVVARNRITGLSSGHN